MLAQFTSVSLSYCSLSNVTKGLDYTYITDWQIYFTMVLCTSDTFVSVVNEKKHKIQILKNVF